MNLQEVLDELIRCKVELGPNADICNVNGDDVSDVSIDTDGEVKFVVIDFYRSE